MESRNFHTALFGGFRKKDVVNFLAEDKRRQEEALQDLNTQIEETVEQIKQLMEQRDAAQEQLQSRQQIQQQLEGDLSRLKEELQAAREENARLEEELQQQVACNSGLQARVEQLEGQISARPEVDAAELQQLREELYAARLRAEELDARLRQQPQSKTAGQSQSMDQLWNLCGKMERTLGQMERLLDGPYRMTCYPEPMESPVEHQEPAVQEVQSEPVMENTAPENTVPVQAPSVKNLLQRIRVKR